MSYYLQILESYLKHKNIDLLLEQAAGVNEIQGSNPQERVSDILNKAKNPQYTQENRLQLSFQGKPFTAWMTKDGSIAVNNGRATFNLTNNPQKFYPFLEGESEASAEPSGESQSSETPESPKLTAGQIKDMQLGWDPIDIKKSLGFSKLQSYVLKLKRGGESNIDLSKIPIFASIKQFFPDRTDAEIMRALETDFERVKGSAKTDETAILDSFDNIFGSSGRSGSIANAISNHKLLVEDVEGKTVLIKKSDIPGATKHLRRIKREVNKLTDKIKRGEKVSTDECEKYQKMFVPLAVKSKTKGRMFFPDPATGTGVVINDRDFKKKKVFDALLKSAGCSVGEDREIGNLKAAGADLRGKFMETLNVLVQQAMSCVNYKGPVGECADNLGNVFERYKEKKLSLIEALKSYDEVDDAAMPLGEEDQGSALAMATLRDYFGDSVPEKILQSTLKLAIESYKIRRPDITQPIAEDTKYGKRGDTLEAWESDEDFEAAMQRQGVPESIYKNHRLRSGRFSAMENSIKSYVTLKDDVGMGSLSKNTFRKIITNICDDCKPAEAAGIMEEIQKFRQGMANFFEEDWLANPEDSQFKQLQEFYKTTQEIENKIESLSTNSITLNSKGKQILVTPLQDYINTMKDQIAREYSYSKYQQSELIQALENFDESDDPRQIKGVIKSFVVGQHIKNNLNNKSAKMYLATMAFGSGGSRNMMTLLTANGVVDGEVITSLQNSTLAPVKNYLDGVAGYKVEISGDGDRVSYHGPKDVSKPEGESVLLYTIDNIVTNTGNVTHAAVSTYENLKRSALTPKL
jgi:hypothetical protein